MKTKSRWLRTTHVDYLSKNSILWVGDQVLTIYCSNLGLLLDLPSRDQVLTIYCSNLGLLLELPSLWQNVARGWENVDA